MTIAEQLKQEQRDDEQLSDIKKAIIELLKERIRNGKNETIFAFNGINDEGKIHYSKYYSEWWSMSEKRRIPITEYLRSEGFKVSPGPLYVPNISVTL